MAKRRRAPVRTCAACGVKADKRELTRVASPPSAPVALDLTGRINGRGTYVCANCGRAPRNIRRERFERSLKTRISEEDWRNLITALSELTGEEADGETARTAESA